MNVGTMRRATQAVITVNSLNDKVTIRRVRLWLVARLRGTGSALFISSYSTNATGATFYGLFAPPGGDTLTTPYVSPLFPADTTGYEVTVDCSGSTANDCAAIDTNVLDIKGAEFTLEESIIPGGAISGGELMAGGPQAGIRGLTYAAHDMESGVAHVSAIIGDTVAGETDFGPTCLHDDFAACPQSQTRSIPVDTRKVPDGTYPVSLRIADAAGNVQTVAASTVVQVANGVAAGPAVPLVPGVSSDVALKAWFAANHRSAFTTRYGPRVLIRGRLSTRDGNAAAGAAVEVSEDVLGSPGIRSTVITASDGRFTYVIAGHSSSRDITVRFGRDLAVEQRLRLSVRAASTLAVTLHGVLVRYHGNVATKPLPRRGKIVEIQGRAPDSAWKVFAKRRTDGRGKFGGTYRLRVHRAGVRLQFRVRIPAEASYPFVAHTGRPLVRTVG